MNIEFRYSPMEPGITAVERIRPFPNSSVMCDGRRWGIYRDVDEALNALFPEIYVR